MGTFDQSEIMESAQRTMPMIHQMLLIQCIEKLKRIDIGKIVLVLNVRKHNFFCERRFFVS